MAGLFDKLERELKFKLSDTTLTSDVNQTLSNILSQTNKVKKTVAQVSIVANRANVQSTNPSLALENLTDVVITALQNGQSISWNGTDWVNGPVGVTPGSIIVCMPSCMPGFSTVSSAVVGNGTTIHVIAGRSIINQVSKWTISVNNVGGSFALANSVIIKCTRDSGTVVSSTPITFGGSSSPTWAAGINTSDAIALALDNQHDYYIMWYITGGGGTLAFYQATSGGQNFGGGLRLTVTGDRTSDNPITLAGTLGGGLNYVGACLLENFLSA